MLINGQEWQDEQAYLDFMSKKGTGPKSKIEIMESELKRLKEMIDAKEGCFETTLRANEKHLILPGGRKIIPVDIRPDWLRDYNCTVEGLSSLKYNSWLKVYPFLQPIYSNMGVTMLNQAQMELAKREPHSLSWSLKKDSSGVYVQDIDRLMDISESEQLLHTAYSISKGDEIATLKLTIR